MVYWETIRFKLLSFIFFLVAFQVNSFANDVTVTNAAGLRNALAGARPGTTIKLAPGNYGNGIQINRLSGTPEMPIIITAADAQNPPLFEGGSQALHFVDCNYITLRGIKVKGCSANGINADDGGSFDTPSKGMVFDNIIIENIGPTGNHDGLKISGLQNFKVTNCTFSGWGGSAIDMVGCQDGLIEHCQFIGKTGFSQDNGVQTKGGTERILIRLNFFSNAGQRSINIGGSTGLAFFRPQLQNYEAKDIEIAGNHFVGSMAPVAYVTSINCRVHHNTIINPERWVIRILQEQPLDLFLPCQLGVFESNLIVFDQRVQTFVNIGPNTRPETFIFNKNAWYSSDINRIPSLPVVEKDGIYQVDPMLQNAGNQAMIIGSNDSRILQTGAHAYKTALAKGHFSYQSVIRNNKDELVINTTVGMRINIIQGSENGSNVYTETQQSVTNINGLISIEIGSKSGFDEIDWSSGPYFLRTEVDPAGGSNYTIHGTDEILSVPYALYARTAESISGAIEEIDSLFKSSAAAGISEKEIIAWENKQEPLVAGKGIKINGNVISIDEEYFKGDTIQSNGHLEEGFSNQNIDEGVKEKSGYYLATPMPEFEETGRKNGSIDVNKLEVGASVNEVDRKIRMHTKGIAAQFPGDEGIENHPSVVFADNFESGNMDDLRSRWGHMSNKDGKVMSFSDDVPEGSAGKRSLKMTATRDENQGGELYKTFDLGWDTIYLRFYTKFTEDHGFQGHFVALRGFNNPLPYPIGGAGSRAENHFSVTIEPKTTEANNYPTTSHAPPGIWQLYAYWPEMHSWQTPEGNPDGRPNPYYGNSFQPVKPAVAPRGKWISVELMVRLNTSPEEINGEMAFWIDGEPVVHFAPGIPRGYWMSSDRYPGDPEIPNARYRNDPDHPDASPFEGFRWRHDMDVKINVLRLQHYIAGFTGTQAYSDNNPEFLINTKQTTVLFDNIVVATEYIGPIVPKE